ncbi:Protein kinase, catalytic domain-containing protein [Artemisia annua]|uniref:Protein kinase, catalytic domain-containing protein n=1 Tax=Artemisia annua TaxID=35608 RepID=A0A2U1MC62_ARTAN|nr:Protein kinase, catalytic domain-containing protein [Artemisia annua]
MCVRRYQDPFLRGLLCCLAMFALSVNVTGRRVFLTEWNAHNSIAQNDTASAPPADSEHHTKRTTDHYVLLSLLLVLAIALLCLIACAVTMRTAKSMKVKKSMKNIVQSSPKTSIALTEVKKEEQHPELVFFVEEDERFRLENLLDAGADMQNQNFCSSLYKVQLNNNVSYAVKRLKKLQASAEEFDRTMTKGMKMRDKMKMQGLNNRIWTTMFSYVIELREQLLYLQGIGMKQLLCLIAVSGDYENCKNQWKYFRSHAGYVEGKRNFPWKLRMSIAVGIARGLDHIYRSFQDSEIIPHGNLKLSNILLNENEEALISEYGYSNLFDPKSVCLLRTNGYTAPERALSEQGDVFSFGVVLLELLTGKIVENSGLDLPKWVKAMVREEWTGEVFDKEIAKVGMYAFPLLNVSLKCVAHFAENRPSIAEVLETIEGVVDEDLSCSSVESSPRDGHVLYSVAEES